MCWKTPVLSLHNRALTGAILEAGVILLRADIPINKENALETQLLLEEHNRKILQCCSSFLTARRQQMGKPASWPDPILDHKGQCTSVVLNRITSGFKREMLHLIKWHSKNPCNRTRSPRQVSSLCWHVTDTIQCPLRLSCSMQKRRELRMRSMKKGLEAPPCRSAGWPLAVPIASQEQRSALEREQNVPAKRLLPLSARGKPTAQKNQSKLLRFSKSVHKKMDV